MSLIMSHEAKIQMINDLAELHMSLNADFRHIDVIKSECIYRADQLNHVSLSTVFRAIIHVYDSGLEPLLTPEKLHKLGGQLAQMFTPQTVS
jgi:hypothetical protein